MLIARYTREHISLVKAFNERLREGGSTFQFDADPSQVQGFAGAANNIRPEHYLLLDEGGNVRGAYSLIFQRLLIGGKPEEVSFLQIPISEGSVNPAFGAVGFLLLKDALHRSPLLFGLGMGGIDQPLPKLFRTLGTQLWEVPFYFKVQRPRAFLRNATALRAKRHLRIASRTAAATGVADLAFWMTDTLGKFSSIKRRELRIEVIDHFTSVADNIWEAASAHYSCIAIRDRETLNYLYPVDDPRYHRLIVSDGAGVAGWVLVTATQMRDHNHFGNMRVGAIVNCLAFAGREEATIAGASYHLRDLDVDLIVSNQFHPAWGRALKRAGFLTYKSNFVFAPAPVLREKIKHFDPAFERVHMNRGDGDGAYNL